MNSSSTLSSLAMLKVNLDEGKDYLEYLRPFVLQALSDHTDEPVTDGGIRDRIREDYGLEIPERAIQIVLRRLAKQNLLTRADGVYRVGAGLPDPSIQSLKSEADRHIRAVIGDLKTFSLSTGSPLASDQEAVDALLSFLTEFEIPCLRAYLRGTAIPDVQGDRVQGVALVSHYVMHLQNNNPERFESLLTLVTGHMLANALMCPDLEHAPKTYGSVTFYLDTPLLVQRLGLEGEHKMAAAEQLISLLQSLGAKVATFSHSKDELIRVIRGASGFVDSLDGRGSIVIEAKRNGTTKSDLLLLAEQVEQKLTDADIEVVNTPPYITDFQIDEEMFEDALEEDEVYYLNPRAKEDDINSVRSIYVLRKSKSPSTIEKARAVLVTSNSGFARAAWNYGREYPETSDVSSVITDFSLANMAWLKAPLGAPQLPKMEIISFAYAALQPSKELLNKYLSEIDRLEQGGEISERDHQLLRSTTLAFDEITRLTLGDDTALSQETITQTLERVAGEIRREETDKLDTERLAHRKSLEELASQQAQVQGLQKRIYWRCRRKARRYSLIVSGVIVILLIVGLAGSVSVVPSNPYVGVPLAIATSLLVVLTFLNIVIGSTIKSLHGKLENWLRSRLIEREARSMGLDLSAWR